MLEVRKRKTDRKVKQSKPLSPARNSSGKGGFQIHNEDNIMTRKPIRIRRQRIPVLQSGYCAICNLPYNSIEDHVQSKKHQKLIGEDANYIALNGYIHSDVGIESLLSLSGIDAIGLDDFSPKIKRRNMPRTRASSVVSDTVGPVKTPQNDNGHRLRSRKNINYSTPPLDEDSFQERPEMEPVRLQYKEYRELRSSTRALAKLTSFSATKEAPDVWDSGRPKRACINRQKRISADERLVADNKTYYKVEVLSNKLRSNEKDKGSVKQKEAKAIEAEKGLIVKFKKLRTSELVQLNNEATNFLFPKKVDSSDDEEDGQVTENGTETEDDSSQTELMEASSTTDVDDAKPPDKFKVEDEASTDSISSECKAKKKRRSHAEAFILDNQKYYKFETPGSSCNRLRYHGSYLSPVPPKCNGDIAKTEPKVERDEEKKDDENRVKLNLNELTFSFETVPENEKWYQTFRRQDRAEQRYYFSNNYYWNDFVLPRQIPHLRPMDPRICYNAYKDLKECVCGNAVCSKSREPSPEAVPPEVQSEEAPEEGPAEVPAEQATDEDSKDSADSYVTAESNEESKEAGASTRSSRRLTEALTLSPTTSRARNSRKSPRQHASTLAILSSLVNQRRKRNTTVCDRYVATLPTIKEETVTSTSIVRKPPTPQRQRKPKVDYFALAAKIEAELNTALDFEVDLEPTTDPDVSFLDHRWSINDLMSINELKTKESDCKKFFNGAPNRKPIKRKKNLTGWPNKTKKRKTVVKEEGCPNGDNASEEDGNITDNNSITEEGNALGEIDDRENKCDRDMENRVGGNDSEEVRDTILQPYVYVKKLDSCENLAVNKVIINASNKRTMVRHRRQRRVLSSHPKKSPRMLRRSGGGRWIRER